MTEKTFPVNNNKVKRYLSMIYPLVVTQNTQREFKLKKHVVATYLFKVNNNTRQPEKLWDYRTKKANLSFIT